jgi:flagellar biogenesis protein FliO
VWATIEARRRTQRRRSLRVVESVSMGEKRFVAIVQVEQARFLVGGGSAGVSLLARLDAAPEFSAVLSEQVSADASGLDSDTATATPGAGVGVNGAIGTVKVAW